MLTIDRTVAEGVTMWTDLADRRNIGPIVVPPPPVTFNKLRAMFAASTLGITPWAIE